MLLLEIAKTKWNVKNKKYYEDLGYEYTKIGDEFDVLIEHLPKYSKSIIKLSCDYCGKYIYKLYCDYRKRIDNGDYIDCCKECMYIKQKNNNIKKYGVSCIFQIDEVKQKVKDNNMKKYGVDNALKLPENREKAREKMMELYGVEYGLQSKDILNKVNDSIMKKYGVKWIGQSEEIRKKSKNTIINKYGVDNIIYLDWVQEKIRNTLSNNNNVPTSKAQLSLYNMLVEMYGEENVKINFPCSKFSLDIYVKLNDINLDIEYDGWYWHKNTKQKDYARDKIIQSMGYKVIRIKSSNLLPSKYKLYQCINDIITNDDFYYKEIILEDWREE